MLYEVNLLLLVGHDFNVMKNRSQGRYTIPYEIGKYIKKIITKIVPFIIPEYS